MSKPDGIHPDTPIPYHPPATSENPSPENPQSYPLLYTFPQPLKHNPHHPPANTPPPQTTAPPDAVRRSRRDKQKKERPSPAG